MSMLTLTNLGQAYGDFDVFTGINASIQNDAKIGLVGPNGIGKTTMLRVLAGLDSPSSGNVNISQGTRIGYLRQEALDAFSQRDSTVYAEMLTVFGDIKAQEAALQEMEARMAAGEATGDLLDEYSEAQQAFELAGGYEYETRISQVLYGLGFDKGDWETPLTQLSGGQKTRALLARLLLESPDLLILDEPTNHLDVQAIEWLEGTLKTWPGALLIVSHDRYFLDKVVDRIWEMSRVGIELYRGNYSAYLLQRQERWDRREMEFNTVKEKFYKELDYIKRNIARDATVNMARGRLKRLIREVRVVQAGGLQAMLDKNWGQVMDEISISETRWGVMDVEQAIKSLQSPIQRPPALTMRFKTTLRSGNLVLRTTAMEIGYPGTSLFHADPIQLERHECAALIGPNGTGKTTFLRTVMGQLEPLAGKVTFGASLKVGYFAQTQDRLNPENTVLDELLRHKQMLLGPARNYLAQYLFRGEDVFKPVKLLSGGERGRLALAILALDGANLLLLDEPTNHLDIPAQEVLQQVLENFEGTILLVSHDRYLIDRLATQIWEVRDGRLHVFPVTYSTYVAERESAVQTAKVVAAEQRAENRRAAVQPDDRSNKNDIKRRERAVAEVEETIQRLEKKLAKIEQDLQTASHAQDLERIQQLSAAYSQTQASLEASMESWAELSA